MATIENIENQVRRGNRDLSSDGYRYLKFVPTSDRGVAPIGGKAERKERSVFCLCCGDSGVVPDYLLRKYGIMDASVEDPAVECKASGCRSSLVQVQSSQTGESQTVPRFAAGCLDNRLTRQDCDFIASAQLAEIQMLADSTPLTEYQSGGALIRAIAQEHKPLSTLPKVEIDPDRIHSHATSSAQALVEIFGDIA
jgi:hypothetical protein